MPSPRPNSYVAFSGHVRVASGDLRTVALATKALLETHPERSVSIFDDATGRVVDLDLRGTPEHIVTGLADDIDPRESEVSTCCPARGSRAFRPARPLRVHERVRRARPRRPTT